MRERFNTFVARHEVPWELTIAVLAVLYVVVGFATDDAPGASSPTWQWSTWR